MYLRPMEAEEGDMTELQSIVTCPACQHRQREVMPIDACQFFYECKSCGAILRPLAQDCCIFCSYGTIPCPSVQEHAP